MEEVKQGQIINVIVTGIQPYGAFIRMENGADGLVYIEDLSVARIKSPNDRVKIGQKIKCMVNMLIKIQAESIYHIKIV